MASRIHPNEMFLTEISSDDIKLLLVEMESQINFKSYIFALQDQITRLDIKL